MWMTCEWHVYMWIMYTTFSIYKFWCLSANMQRLVPEMCKLPLSSHQHHFSAGLWLICMGPKFSLQLLVFDHAWGGGARQHSAWFINWDLIISNIHECWLVFIPIHLPFDSMWRASFVCLSCLEPCSCSRLRWICEVKPFSVSIWPCFCLVGLPLFS